jgi:hypothetical protein
MPSARHAGGQRKRAAQASRRQAAAAEEEEDGHNETHRQNNGEGREGLSTASAQDLAQVSLSIRRTVSDYADSSRAAVAAVSRSNGGKTGKPAKAVSRIATAATPVTSKKRRQQHQRLPQRQEGSSSGGGSGGGGRLSSSSSWPRLAGRRVQGRVLTTCERVSYLCCTILSVLLISLAIAEVGLTGRGESGIGRALAFRAEWLLGGRFRVEVGPGCWLGWGWRAEL